MAAFEAAMSVKSFPVIPSRTSMMAVDLVVVIDLLLLVKRRRQLGVRATQ